MVQARLSGRKQKKPKEDPPTDAEKIQVRIARWRPKNFSVRRLHSALERIKSAPKDDSGLPLINSLSDLRLLAEYGDASMMSILGATLWQLATTELDPDKQVKMRFSSLQLDIERKEQWRLEAVFWLQLAVERMDGDDDLYSTTQRLLAYALAELGMYEEAVHHLEPLVEAGEVEQKLLLAEAYANTNREDEARDLLMNLCSENNPDAMISMAWLEFRNERPEDAVFWLLQAHNLGSSEAAIRLGNHYYDQRQYRDAERLWRDAAQQGESKGMIKLARLFADRKDVKSARHWYEMATAKGDRDSGVALQIHYLENEGQV
jgi:TPR repeat protein